ncbi:hypothetical protein C2845_PM11G04190 [Panicum miliaceum]|uniref:UspA domain-containing protein n=1 Tax=Panicum miliaceum TaxID=4540 RepID=A0A3L6RV63_PANMI|nr:hypothetical protein C2845_PM11G04190 [Panicum miliaceum]
MASSSCSASNRCPTSLWGSTRRPSPSADPVEVKMEVTVGDAKEKICEVSANRNADLLVMGCRAIGPLKI